MALRAGERLELLVRPGVGHDQRLDGLSGVDDRNRQQLVEGGRQTIVEALPGGTDLGIGVVDQGLELAVERHRPCRVQRSEDLGHDVVAPVAGRVDHRRPVRRLRHLEPFLGPRELEVGARADAGGDVVHRAHEAPHQVLVDQPRGELGVR